MDNKGIMLFDGQKVRSVWNEEDEKWYFSIVDIVEILSGSNNPKQYIKKMKMRDESLASSWGTICTLTKMKGSDGKYYKQMAADTEGVFRIIQSIPSPKAEPFKQWIAKVASQRLDQMQNPELSIDQAVNDYRRLGYSEGWINNRLKSIEVRKALTDEWKRGGVQGQQYATLTDIITKEWSGKTTKQYKNFKGLKKENLRDNMTNVELALNTLAEASATEISKQQNPKGLTQNRAVAKKGGSVAKAARNQLEKQLGHSVISSDKATDYIAPIEEADTKEIE